MGNRTVLARIRRLGEQAVDRFEYAVFAARLKMVDWLYGPEPPTEADRDRSELGGPSCDRALHRERIQHSRCLVRDRARCELGVSDDRRQSGKGSEPLPSSFDMFHFRPATPGRCRSA